MSTTSPALSRFLGGALGRHARSGGVWFTAGPWAMVAVTLSWLLLMLRQIPCLDGADDFPDMCYSDITALYYWRGLQEGKVPFLDSDVEYPVLTGALMELTRRLMVLLGGRSEPGLSSSDVAHAATLYFGVNALVLFALFLLLVWTHLRMSRPWDALMIAVAPAIWTTGLINWDALVVALTSLALLAWARRRPGWAGVWLGLGIAAKLYPLLLLVPLAVLCLRARRVRDFLIVAGAAAASWVAVNLPVFLLSPEGWLNFWTFNVDRGGDLGSLWYVLQLAGVEVPGVSRIVSVLMVVGTLAICLMLLLAPRRPRLAQGAFLIVALFLIVNKVYSPQYVLWLLPLLVLARPRWLDWTVFSVAELAYYVAIWGHLDGVLGPGAGGPDRLYWAAVVVRIVVQLWLCARVIGDMWRPEGDVVRAAGLAGSGHLLDDPDGGVLDGRADAPWLVALRRRFLRANPFTR